VGELLNKRRDDAAARMKHLRAQLKASEDRCAGKACVYITGSFARGEASTHSDLDLFIVSKNKENSSDGLLSRLDEICVKAELIQETRNLEFPEFSGDGEYLVKHTESGLIKTLGTSKDDAENTFTARLLLLLESQCLLGQDLYKEITDNVIGAYWRDYEDHKNTFVPAYLANDILRLWRTFCVNYEARTKTEPAEQKAKRKLKNYKLKHSRLLTCYSALLYLSAVYAEAKTVHPDDAVQMISLTPSARLEWLLSKETLGSAHENIEKLLSCYEDFLRITDKPEVDLIMLFENKEESKVLFEAARRFGDLMFQILLSVGGETPFHRLLLV
jgi:predicted nucleotidyltransferase